MLYLLALVLPPVAVLLCGKPLQAVLNILLCIAFVVPGVIHAILVVHDHKQGKRHKQLVRAMSS